MKKNFIIILFLVLITLIGCSIQSDIINLTLKVDSTPVTFIGNGEIVVLSKAGSSSLITIDLNSETARLLGITENSVVFSNIQPISENEVTASIEFSQLETVVQSFINECRTNAQAIMDIMGQIEAEIAPTGGIITFAIKNIPKIVSIQLPKPEVVEIVILPPDGEGHPRIAIGIDVNGDGKTDYWIILTNLGGGKLGTTTLTPEEFDWIFGPHGIPD